MCSVICISDADRRRSRMQTGGALGCSRMQTGGALVCPDADGSSFNEPVLTRPWGISRVAGCQGSGLFVTLICPQ